MNEQTDLFASPTPTDQAMNARLGQYMTELWAAERLVASFFPKLDARDIVLEPSCGTGAFLAAIPDETPAVGVEIDPALAAIAAESTGRRIIVGDFRHVPIDVEPTVIIGNLPFGSRIVQAFLARIRTLLTPGARAGLILPAYQFSFASTTIKLLRGLEVHQFIVPRDLFPRIAHPLIFTTLSRATETKLIGFALFEEAYALRSMRAEYRTMIATGRRPIWRQVITAALTALGGEASLEMIYRVVENYRPTSNPWWRDTIRRVAGESFERIRPGVFRLPNAA